MFSLFHDVVTEFEYTYIYIYIYIYIENRVCVCVGCVSNFSEGLSVSIFRVGQYRLVGVVLDIVVDYSEIHKNR
jgi:hypothetical protein